MRIRHLIVLIALLAIGWHAHAQTSEQYGDPTFWQRQKAAVQATDNKYGLTLAQRAAECEEQNLRISREVSRAGDFIIKFHLLASPSRGYITPAAAGQDKRQIIAFAEVGHRDIRYAKYDGADVDQCMAIADRAVARIQDVIAKYPDFATAYDPNADTTYR